MIVVGKQMQMSCTNTNNRANEAVALDCDSYLMLMIGTLFSRGQLTCDFEILQYYE